MTAFMESKRSFDPLSRSWGYSVAHQATHDAAWGFTENDARVVLWARVRLAGYERYTVEEKRRIPQTATRRNEQ